MLPSPPSSLHYLKEISITRGMADLYYTAGGLEKKGMENRQTENRQRTENRYTNYRGHSNSDGLLG